MLTHLHIRNYALITQLDIDFHEGFPVLTGETGAGKSIILGALNLVMGARADTKTITEGEERCVIEATFRPPKAVGCQIATLLDHYVVGEQRTNDKRKRVPSRGDSFSFYSFVIKHRGAGVSLSFERHLFGIPSVYLR